MGRWCLYRLVPLVGAGHGRPLAGLTKTEIPDRGAWGTPCLPQWVRVLAPVWLLEDSRDGSEAGVAVTRKVWKFRGSFADAHLRMGRASPAISEFSNN